MDGKSDLLNLVRGRLTSFDDDALAAMANKGLLRRAYKDLEELPPRVLGESDGKLRVGVGEEVVEVDPTPNQSTCSCPAGGVCRHILAALILLREPSEQTNEPISCEEEILSIDEDTLRAWAGSQLLRKAMQRVGQGLDVQVEGAAPMLLSIPSMNVTCRWMPGGGLEGMVCSCHSQVPCEHRVAAVLAYQVSRGRFSPVETSSLLEASPGAPRTREEVRDSVRNVIAGMVAHGLSMLSSETEQRLRTLAVSAHGVDLPRLERILKALADEVVMQMSRDARADTRNLLYSAALAEALCCALAKPSAGIVGAHRSRFESVGMIDLTGVGARRWRTRSGYAGLTVYFWDKSARNWASWTDARPTSVEVFDGLARYRQPGPWEGCIDPSHASRSEVRLSSTWRNPSGRLSGRSSTRATLIEASEIAGVPAVLDWSDIADRAIRLFGGGLTERDERDEVVLLQPSKWGRPKFDKTRQEMIWPVWDASGRELTMLIPNSPETSDAMRLIEKSGRFAPKSVLGLLRMAGGRVVVEPVSLHGASGVLNLTLDGSSALPSRQNAQSAGDDVLDYDYEPAPAEAADTPLGLLLAAIESQLERIAESGVSAVRDLDSLAELAARADSVGLSACSRPVVRLIDALTSRSEQRISAETLLRAYYVCRVASAQESVMAMVNQ